MSPDGRRLIVKGIEKKVQETGAFAIDSSQAPALIAPAVKSQLETHLALDLSQSGDIFEETLIVPATQTAFLADGSVRAAQKLQLGDRICMSGQNIARVTKIESKWHTSLLSPQPDKNGNVTSRVIGTTKRLANCILFLHTGTETIGTTPEHPFSVEGKGWVQAGRLHPGDRIQTEDGKLITVQRLEVKPERRIVYNLLVEGTHTYFVGKNKLLVHNGGECVPTFAGDYLTSKAPKQVTPGVRQLEGQYINDMGRVEPWRAHYDGFGRMIGRTDSNAGNHAAGIPSVHHHVYEYGPGYSAGRKVGGHIPGPYIPPTR